MWRWYDNLADIDPSFWLQQVLRHPRPSPFLHPAFLRPWAEFFGGNLKVGCWQDGGLILLHQVADGWELLGGQDVADRLDGLSCDPEFWTALRAEHLPIRFPNLAEDAWALQARRPEDWLEVTDQSPYVPLTGDFETYLRTLTKHQRHELQRKTRRAERLSENGLRLTQGAQDLDVFLRLHRLSSPQKAKFMFSAMEQFFRQLTESLDQAGMLQLTTLWDGAKPLASVFQIRFNQVMHLYNSGYDPAYSALAPGMVLLGHCIREACQEGLREYDLLRGTERYKYDVGGQDRAVYRLTWPAA